MTFRVGRDASLSPDDHSVSSRVASMPAASGDVPNTTGDGEQNDLLCRRVRPPTIEVAETQARMRYVGNAMN